MLYQNSCNSNVILHADNSDVICSEKIIHNLNLKCNSKVGNIENWIDYNKLSINYKKNNCVLFSKTSKNESVELKIATHSEFIETTSVVKYLGVFFDKTLNWETHTQFALDKMCSAKGILSKVRLRLHLSLTIRFRFWLSNLSRLHTTKKVVYI